MFSKSQKDFKIQLLVEKLQSFKVGIANGCIFPSGEVCTGGSVTNGGSLFLNIAKNSLNKLYLISRLIRWPNNSNCCIYLPMPVVSTFPVAAHQIFVYPGWNFTFVFPWGKVVIWDCDALEISAIVSQNSADSLSVFCRKSFFRIFR